MGWITRPAGVTQCSTASGEMANLPDVETTLSSCSVLSSNSTRRVAHEPIWPHVEAIMEESLASDAVLLSLKYVSFCAFPPAPQRLPLPSLPHSLAENFIGVEGVSGIARALSTNSVLTELK